MNSTNGYSFFIPVFILFYVAPVFTDLITGLGFRLFYRHINEAIQDNATSIIYNFYISLLLVFFVWHSKRLRSNSIKFYKDNVEKIAMSFLNIYKKYFTLLFLLLIFPFIVTLIYGDLSYYSVYNRIGQEESVPDSHSLISKLVLFDVILISFLITGILLDKKLFHRDRQFVFPFLFLVLLGCFWLHGKRSIVANYIVIQFVFLLISQAVSSKTILRQLLVVLVSFVLFLVGYGKNIADNAIDNYYGFRLDFTRDYGVKFAIYNDLLLERHILPYDWASFLFNVTFYIPRELWFDKPQPYAVYFTNSVFGNYGGNDSYGWGFTTSIFGEHISNIGWLGLFTAPLLLYIIFRYENRSVNPFFKLLSILIAILLIVLHPVAFMVLILLYIVFLVKGEKRIIFK
ncbi:hypothetical protein HX021_16720 [Sphingobacterium sp. N143]|uniref:hypothetical protein n=1 Tax=Sphingobacterium sp. N143 TaxID=2746727 RepID=UPI002577B971|nr:hypothetical protein [Sphingobacterium sp. N143]MDM1295936.1 hypothetical protein [Sphingobacterium sp. N143]